MFAAIAAFVAVVWLISGILLSTFQVQFLDL